MRSVMKFLLLLEDGSGPQLEAIVFDEDARMLLPDVTAANFYSDIEALRKLKARLAWLCPPTASQWIDGCIKSYRATFRSGAPRRYRLFDTVVNDDATPP